MSTENLLPFDLAYSVILGSCLIGFLFGYYNWLKIKEIDTNKRPESKDHILSTPIKKEDGSTTTPLDLMNKTSVLIQEGALNFLLAEYLYISVFLVLFSVLIF